MKLRFTKMQGAGNDFVVLDATRAPLELDAAQYRRLADRRFGVGADQILRIERSDRDGVDFGYRIFNGGSGEEVEHCGNGARCFMRYVLDNGLSDRRRLRVNTLNNLLELSVDDDDGRVRVDMNAPVFEPARVPFDTAGLTPREVDGVALWPLEVGGARIEVAVLSMGNPHAVQIVDDVDAAPVGTQGPLIERHPRFARGVNAGFMQIVDRGRIRLRVHERGAGETLACGTGACAAVVTGVALGRLNPRVDVDARGGRLTIEWPGRVADRRTDDPPHVLMSGPAETVYVGEIEL